MYKKPMILKSIVNDKAIRDSRADVHSSWKRCNLIHY